MGALAVLPRFTVAFALAIALPHADRQEKDLGDEATSLVTLKKVLNKAFAIANGSGSDTVWMNNVKTEPVNVTVFYHLFLRNLQDKERVAGIVRNQLKQIPAMSLSEISEIRINSVGAPVNIADVKVSPELEKKTQVLAHYTEGWEKVTLHDLWSFCREKNTDPNQIVVYLHSKGSKAMYDAYGQEVKSRHSAYVTTGAVSQECLHMPNYCNICSTRMSPLPYMQTPGNMWAARCGHVAQLKDPKNFDQDMLKVQDAEKTELDMCIGTSHFAAEHWVYAHPAAAPCDLDTSVMYSGPWKINQDPPKELYAKELKKAPRFELQAYHWPDAPCQGWGEALPRHLAEYRVLYGTEPAADWWGWIFFKQS